MKKRKLDETDVLLECEALECLDEELFKMPHPRKKVQLTDPTTVRNSRSITLLEEFFPTQSVKTSILFYYYLVLTPFLFQIDDCHHNEFGIMSVDEFEMFIESDRSQESVKTMLDCMKNKKRKMSEEISDDIARTSYQTKLMKSCDISQDFSCFEDPILHDVVTSFDSSINQVNIIEDDTIIENHETYPPVLKNTENYDLNSEINVEEIMLPRVDRLQFKKKQKRIKKCIFVDKHMKITNKSSILSSFVQYQKLQTEDLPRVNFEQMIYKHKFGVDVLFQTQARRNMSPHLLLLVKRHLKKIPQTLIDRKFTKKASIENETTPILKRPTTRFNRAVIKCSGERFNNTILETELLDQEDEMLKSSRMQHYLIDDEVTIPGPAPKRNPRTNYTDFEEYDEE